MTENNLIFLKNMLSQYELQFSRNFKEAAILNPCYNENIKVYYYEDHDSTPYCICFSYQHCHLADEEEVVAWINEIIIGKKVAIEFFRNGSSVFGGDIDREELRDLSYEKLMEITGYVGLAELLDIADSFKVRGWNREDNFDGSFCRDSKGKIFIQREFVPII